MNSLDGTLTIILFNQVPYDKTHGSDDERSQDVRGDPNSEEGSSQLET
jgi:hypothetical protein